MELVTDVDSVAGRLVTTGLVVAVAVPLALVVGRLVSRRFDDPYARYYARKVVRYVVGVVTVLALALIWRAFAGRAGVVLGLMAAGVAFAMQEVIGALAGWFNIVSGRIFRVGDRIEMGGVRGDVIDITPLRTKVVEIGSASDDESWVRGRQYTGRIVAISNKATFSQPVFNFSAILDFIWEEMSFPIPHGPDWQRAEQIIRAEITAEASTEEAREAMREMLRRYPVPRAEVEPAVFVRPTDNWVELVARFPVPVRVARLVKDDVARRVLDRFAAAGIELASETADVTVRRAGIGKGSHDDHGG